MTVLNSMTNTVQKIGREKLITYLLYKSSINIITLYSYQPYKKGLL